MCVLLGYLGAQPPEGIYVIAGRILTFCYFAYFLIVLPLLSRIETPRPIPNSIADDVLAKSGKQRRWCPPRSRLLVAGALFAGSAPKRAPPRIRQRRRRSHGRSRALSATMIAARCSAA